MVCLTFVRQTHVFFMRFYQSFFLAERRIFVRIPRIRAQAIAVMVTLPIAIAIPPIPQIRITEVVKRFAWFSRSTFCIILRPDTAIKPYSVTHTPPITQPGIESRNATKGEIKDIATAIIAVVVMVTTDAFLVIATQPTDSP